MVHPTAPDHAHHQLPAHLDPDLEALCDKVYATVTDQLGPASSVLYDRAEALIPPPDLVNVLRSPVGPPRVVAVSTRRRFVFVRVTPSGRNDPIAEQRIWAGICHMVRESPAA